MNKETINRNPDPPSEDERPPLLSTWPRLYAAVLGSLIVYVLLMLIFMEVFS